MPVKPYAPFAQAERGLELIKAGNEAGYDDLLEAAQIMAPTTAKASYIAEPLFRILEKLAAYPDYKAEAVNLAAVTLGNIACQIQDADDPTVTGFGSFILSHLDALQTVPQKLHAAAIVKRGAEYAKSTGGANAEDIIEKLVMQVPSEWRSVFALIANPDIPIFPTGGDAQIKFDAWCDGHSKLDVLHGEPQSVPKGRVPSLGVVAAFATKLG